MKSCLHLPGDGTLTYGYGEKIDDAHQITENLKKQYPDMNEAEAILYTEGDYSEDFKW